MTVFNTVLKIVNKYKFNIILYTVLLVSFAGINFKSGNNTTNFVETKPDIYIINDDENKGITKDLIKYLNKNTNIKDLDNIENITIHLEIEKNIKEILSKIKSLGFKRGLSIKPNTDINKLVPYLDDIDLILVMTVEPGLGGQQFLESSTKRLKEIKELIGTRDILLEVDGGINNNTINLVKDANIAVVGSYITKSTDPVSQINSLLV